jgi:flagellar biosynthetic protein FlhB
MAEEQDKSQKTEAPTQKRLEEARKKGDFAKSQDVPAWFMLMAAAALIAGGAPLAVDLVAPLTRILDHPHEFRLDAGGAQRLVSELASALLAPIALIFAALFVGALAGHLIQHRPAWTLEKMKPELDKLSPIKGFERMFGAQGWVNLVKSIFKMAAVAAAAAYAVWPDRTALAESGQLSAVGLLVFTQELLGKLLIAGLAVIGVIAALDYLFQRQSFMERMKMSRRDIRDEIRQTEGDPMVRARLRQIRSERARRRMLAAVPEATVVITNPTHYSVALRYLPDKDAAPVCVAKGVDELALRIREKAREAEVPLVENVALARALFASVEVDETIPREHFEAVARVIGFVLNAGKRRSLS